MRRGLGFHARRSPGVFNPASLFLGGTVQGAWYDPSDATTLFTDRAGTTPCGTPGGGSVVPVGLMLDKSQGLVLGSELVTNGGPGFVNTTGWATQSNATVSVDNGELKLVSSTSSSTAGYFDTTTVAGATYRVVCSIRTTTSSGNVIQAWNGAFSSLLREISIGASTTTTVTFYFQATGTTTRIAFGPGNAASTVFLTSITVKALAGNHAIAANDTTARPELRARVNLLTYSEQFENAYWIKTRSSIAANATTAPDGTLTADKLVEDTNPNSHLVSSGTATGSVFSVYAKAAERSWIALQQSNPGRFAYFDLTNGIVGTSTNATGSIQSVGNGWYRCTITVTSGSSAWDIFIATGNGTASYTGDGTSGVLIWGAQLTATNEFPANTYQRIVDANTYDAVGFPRYLAFNGTSSAMSTPGNVNLSGTDKATVFAGVRKNSGTSGVISELSANVQVNNGAFVLASAFVSATTYDVQVRGTDRNARSYDTYTAPVSNALSSEITTTAANSAAAMQTRVNGAVNAGSSFLSVTSTGNFGSYPLFIGARNTSSLFLNGNIYSLIVVGSAVSAGQISATEQWVAGKTGITI